MNVLVCTARRLTRSLLCSVQVVGPRPVHGAGALLSRVLIASIALIYLHGHDRASVSLGSSGSPHTDHRTEFPYLSCHVLFLVVLSSPGTLSRSVTITLSPPVSRSFVRAAGLARLDVRSGAHLSSSSSFSGDVTNSRGDLLPVDDTLPGVADGLAVGASVSLTPVRVVVSLVERDRRSCSSSPCR